MPLMQLQQDRFWQEHYGRQVSNLDTIFYAAYTLMIAVMKKTVVPQRRADQLIMTAAMCCCISLQLLKHLNKTMYLKWRTPLVFLFHVMITMLRAVIVLVMASEHAVHWRATYDNASRDNPWIFFTSMLATSGGLVRYFEVLGLQMPFHLHLLVTIYYVVLQVSASLPGFRRASSFSFFYTVHELYDDVAAVLDTVLESLVPLPAARYFSCSSCPNLVLYATVVLFFGAVMPLYVVWTVERSARLRYKQQQQQQQVASAEAATDASSTAAAAAEETSSIATAAAAAAGAGVVGNSIAGLARQGMPQQQQQDNPYMLAVMHIVRSTNTSGSTNSTAELQQALQAVQQLESNAVQGSTAATCTAHAALLLLLLLLCWQIAAAVAYVLLPRLLSSKQLNLWCPNRPVVPYLIAGQTFESSY